MKNRTLVATCLVIGVIILASFLIVACTADDACAKSGGSGGKVSTVKPPASQPKPAPAKPVAPKATTKKADIDIEINGGSC